MKLKVNTIAGVLDIIASIVYAFSIVLIFAGAVTTSKGEGATTMASGLLIFAVICLGVHIYGLIKSKQNNMKISGHVLGIIGHAIYACLGALLSLPAMILAILAAVFTFINNKPAIQQTTEEI